MRAWISSLICFLIARSHASETSRAIRGGRSTIRQLQDNQAALDQAKSLWTSFNTNEYSYHVRTTDFFYDVTFASFVSQNQITAITSNLEVASGEEVLQSIRPPTVGGFFDKIQEAIDDDVKNPIIAVVYDSVYGYPTNVSLNYGDAAPGFFFLTDTIDATIVAFVPVSEELASLTTARQQWKQFGYQNYDTIFKDELLDYQVAVRDGVVVRVLDEVDMDITSNYPPGTPEADRLLVDKQFDEMETILADTFPKAVDVLYHPTNGYITSAKIDYLDFTENGDSIVYAVLELSEEGTQSPINPTAAPSDMPTRNPTKTPTDSPSTSPTQTPSASPTESQIPTPSPTKTATKSPSKGPTTSPSKVPTASPTAAVIISPTIAPSPPPTESFNATLPPITDPTNGPSTSETLAPSSNRAGGPCVPRFSSCTSDSNTCCGAQDSCTIGGICRPGVGNQKDGRDKLSRDDRSAFDLNRRKLKVRGA